MHCVIVVITVFIALVSLLYFLNLFSYSAIQPQVCNKLSVRRVAINKNVNRTAYDTDYRCRTDVHTCNSTVMSS